MAATEAGTGVVTVVAAEAEWKATAEAEARQEAGKAETTADARGVATEGEREGSQGHARWT